MKKLYSMTLALAVALSAAAGAPALKTGAPVRTIASSDFKMVKKATIELPATAIKKAPAKVAAADIAGDYEFTIGDVYFQNGAGLVDCEASVTVNGTTVIFDCPDFVTQTAGVFDATTSTISFSEIEFGEVTMADESTMYLKFEPFTWSSVTEDVTPQSFLAACSATEISFDTTDDFAYGFSWVVYEDKNYTTPGGYVDIFDMYPMTKIVDDPNPNAGWTSLGNATLQDGWLSTVLGDAQTWEVELQQNDETKTVYRLVNPYKGDSPMAQYNSSTRNGYIQFDVADPKHVVFECIDAGFKNSQLQFTKFYPMNVLSMFCGYTGYEADYIIEMLGEDGIPYTTFKDGVVLLPSTAQEDGSYENDACWGDQSKPFGGIGWTNNGKAVNMETKITFPDAAGIYNVNVETENAAAPVYYNLQGVRVANPESGLFIEVRGNKASKIIR